MQINDQQKELIKQWVREGETLAGIQRRLREELGISMTYMDVRFLVLDLGLEIKDRKASDTPPLQNRPAISESEEYDGYDGDPAYDEQEADSTGDFSGGGVSVSLDRVVKPGSLVSGTVKFSDGTNGTWFLDRLGRLALQTDKPGYKPSGQDLQSFQLELRKVLERSGL